MSECLQAPRVREPPANKQTEDRARRGSPRAGGGGGPASPGPRRASPRPRPARDRPLGSRRPPARTAAGRAATPRQPGPWFPLSLSTMPRPSPGQPDCEVGWGETRLCKPFLFCKATEKACSGPPHPRVSCPQLRTAGRSPRAFPAPLPPSLVTGPRLPSAARPGWEEVCVCGGGAGSGVASSNAFCKCRVPGLRAPTVEFSPSTRGLAQSGRGRGGLLANLYKGMCMTCLLANRVRLERRAVDT